MSGTYDDDQAQVYWDLVGEALFGPTREWNDQIWGGFIEDCDYHEVSSIAQYLSDESGIITQATGIFGSPRLVRRLPGVLNKYMITHDGLIYLDGYLRTRQEPINPSSVDQRNQALQRELSPLVRPTTPYRILADPKGIKPNVEDSLGHPTVFLTDVYGHYRPYRVSTLLGNTFLPPLPRTRRIYSARDNDPTFCHVQNIGYVDFRM